MRKSLFIGLMVLTALAAINSCKIGPLFFPNLPEINGTWTVVASNIRVDVVMATSTGLIGFRDTSNYPAFYSTDHGATWSSFSNAAVSRPIWMMADVNDNSRITAYSAIDSNLYLSTNGGQTWSMMNHPTDSVVRTAHWISGNRLFAQIFYFYRDTTVPFDSLFIDSAAIQQKYFILKSDDFGNTWDTVIRHPYPFTLFDNSASLFAIRSINASLYAFTSNQIYKSADNGSTWVPINSVIPTGGQYVGILTNRNVIGYGTYNFYQSSDSCRTWLPVLNDTYGQNGSIVFDSCVMVILGNGNIPVMCGSPTTGKWMAADRGIGLGIFGGSPSLTFDNQYVYLSAYTNIYRRPRADFAGL